MGKAKLSAMTCFAHLLLVWSWIAWTSAQSPACSGCHSTSTPSGNDIPSRGTLSLAEREFRTNLVKLKILKALGLENPPNVTSSIPKIPHSFEEMSFEHEPKELVSPPKVFLIGRKVSNGCLWNQTALCFHFEDDGSKKCEIKSEKLWVYTQANITNDVIIYESYANDFMHRIAIDAEKKDGWISIELEPRRGQITSRNFSFSLYQSNDTNTIDSTEIFGKHTPLLEITTEKCLVNEHREKRSLITQRCGRSHTRDSQCCLQQFEVNFTAIGWNNWIRAPPTFSANYCRGRCNYHVMAIDYNHRNLMYLYSRHLGVAAMLPCCVPVNKTFLQAIVYHTSNQTLGSKVIPGISASACECF